ncbi:MAG: response regulator [Chrysiogenales bacterium]|nr:MAG: response regulator [Chrysiogenales bacterium]
MGKKKLVLVIDDDPEILQSSKLALEAHGHEVTTALSGAEGIEAFERRKPDLVLCDMMMERIDTGIGVASAIRSRDGNVPIYLMSSVGESMGRNVDIHELGFNGLLQKPVGVDDLIMHVNRALRIE